MYERVLFPTDGSETAAAALDYAIEVATEHDATLHVQNVADTGRDSVTRMGGEVVDVLAEEGERTVAETAERARARGVSVVTEVLQGDPSATIVDYADEAGIDVVVMPTHGQRGLERLLLGSVTERVVNASNVPVLTVDPDADRAPTYPPGDVLVPTDGSDGAELALAAAIEAATATGATLHVLHVVETAALGLDVRSSVAETEFEEQAEEIVAEAVETAESASVDATGSVVSGRPHREILSYVDEHGVDLLAVGTHGRTDFGRYVLGGVASKIVRTSPVPVLMVREPDS